MIAEKVSNAASQAGAGVAVVSGGHIGVELVLGLSTSQWSVVGVIGGLLIGVAGLGLNAYFQHKRNRYEAGR